MRFRKTWLIGVPLCVAIVAGLLLLVRTTGAQQGEGIEPKCRQMLEATARTLKEAKSFRTDVASVMKFEMPGMKVDMSANYDLAVSRPGKFAFRKKDADQAGAAGAGGVTIINDGKKLTIWLPGENKYSVQDAPETVEDTIEQAGLFMSRGGGAMMFLHSLLSEDAVESLLEGVDSARYLGEERQGDRTVHRMLFTQEQFDWELSVDAGERAWPVRLDMKIKPERDMPVPQMGLTFGGWKHDTALPDEVFAFKPPEGAEQVDDLLAEFMGGGEDEPHKLLGKQAPPLKLPLLDDGQLDLAAHKGKDVVVLDFWATWCGPCVQALPKLIETTDKFKDRNVVFYAVNSGEDAGTARAFMKKKKLSCKVALDEDSDADRPFGIEGIPQTVVIDKEGVVQAVHVGYGPGTEKELQKEIEAILAGKKPAEEKLKEAKEHEQEEQETLTGPKLEKAWSVEGALLSVAADPTGARALAGAIDGELFTLTFDGRREPAVDAPEKFSPAIALRLGNLAGDREPEIISFTVWGQSVDARTSGGDALWSHPGGDGVDDVWAADLNGDGLCEVIVGHNGGTGLHVLDNRGELLWKNTRIGNVWHVCAANVIGDAKPEVITTSAAGRVHLFSHEGKELGTLDPGLYGNMVRTVRIKPADETQAIIAAGAGGDGLRAVCLNGDGAKRWTIPLASGKRAHIVAATAANGKPWMAFGLGDGLVKVVEASAGKIIGEIAGQGQRPDVAWLEPKGEAPLLLVASGKGVTAYRVPTEVKAEAPATQP